MTDPKARIVDLEEALRGIRHVAQTSDNYGSGGRDKQELLRRLWEIAELCGDALEDKQ